MHMENVLKTRNGHSKPRGTWITDIQIVIDWMQGFTCPTSRGGADRKPLNASVLQHLLMHWNICHMKESVM